MIFCLFTQNDKAFVEFTIDQPAVDCHYEAPDQCRGKEIQVVSCCDQNSNTAQQRATVIAAGVSSGLIGVIIAVVIVIGIIILIIWLIVNNRRKGIYTNKHSVLFFSYVYLLVTVSAAKK